MFWIDDEEQQLDTIPDTIVDMMYTISGRTLPADHAHALHVAITAALPWLADEPDAGIHLIHVAESGNGWERPDDDLLYLSRRTKFTIRLPKERVSAAEGLVGQTLSVAGNEIEFLKAAIRPFSVMPTMYSRYVLSEPAETEEAFLHRCASELKTMGVPVRKMMAGKQHTFALPAGERLTRTLLVADLSPQHAVLLQQRGLGEGRKHGFGLFIPHKGIGSVKGEDGKTQSKD